MTTLQGVFPVIPTLFTAQNAVDPDAMRCVIRFALDAGAHGVVFPGVASEYNFLSPGERGIDPGATMVQRRRSEMQSEIPDSDH